MVYLDEGKEDHPSALRAHVAHACLACFVDMYIILLKYCLFMTDIGGHHGAKGDDVCDATSECVYLVASDLLCGIGAL